MKVLWLCNIMLPAIAKSLGQRAVVKEGWLSGLADRLLEHQKENGCELGICFPTKEKLLDPPGEAVYYQKGEIPGIQYYMFEEDTAHPEVYHPEMEEELKAIIQDFKPEIVHCFGTEYPHTLALTKAWNKPERTLIGIQGLCYVYADYYMADLPTKIQNGRTFRDILKRDSIREQQQKFVQRGKYEIEAIKATKHITGRTDFDSKYTKSLNPEAVYHFMNETLRLPFYTENWSIDSCERHSIFVSQGNYPIKGLHYVLEQLPKIVEKYPDTKVYVAGDIVTAYSSVKDKLKISEYGKYLLKLIESGHLEEHVVFLGPLNADQMCARYLRSHVFLLPSAIENSPNSVGEAMIMGIPVVSADIGGVHNLCTHNKEGFLYPAKHPEQMTEYIFRIFEDDRLAMSISSNAQEHAKLTHDPDTNYKRLLEIYHEINDSI